MTALPLVVVISCCLCFCFTMTSTQTTNHFLKYLRGTPPPPHIVVVLLLCCVLWYKRTRRQDSPCPPFTTLDDFELSETFNIVKGGKRGNLYLFQYLLPGLKSNINAELSSKSSFMLESLYLLKIVSEQLFKWNVFLKNKYRFWNFFCMCPNSCARENGETR